MLYVKEPATRRYRPATAAEIHAANREHVLRAYSRGRTMLCPTDSRDLFLGLLAGRPDEVFCVAYLDNRHRIIECREQFHGTIDSTAVYPRVIVRDALALNAAAVLLAHNHPSGIAEPSDADRIITIRLRDALALVDVRVLDHLVIGMPDAEPVSMAARGLM